MREDVRGMRILIADDHPIFREGLRHMVNGLFEAECILEAGDLNGVTRVVQEFAPLDLVILDLFFPGFDVRRDFKTLRNSLMTTPIIAVSMTSDIADVNAILDAGANGFISKSVRPDIMQQAILDIMQGERVVRMATSTMAMATSGRGSQKLGKLSVRQLQVLKLIARGFANKEIARELDISHNTVRIHVSALFKTLGVSSRSAAASFAAARGVG